MILKITHPGSWRLQFSGFALKFSGSQKCLLGTADRDGQAEVTHQGLKLPQLSWPEQHALTGFVCWNSK